MRKKLLFTVWLLVPIVVLAFHYGPGQKGVAREEVASKIKTAQEAEAVQDWRSAMTAYEAAIAILPGDQKTVRFKLQHAHAHARMFSGELPEAIGELEGLLGEMLNQSAPIEQMREVRGMCSGEIRVAEMLMARAVVRRL